MRNIIVKRLLASVSIDSQTVVTTEYIRLRKTHFILTEYKYL